MTTLVKVHMCNRSLSEMRATTYLNMVAQMLPWGIPLPTL